MQSCSRLYTDRCAGLRNAAFHNKLKYRTTDKVPTTIYLSMDLVPTIFFRPFYLPVLAGLRNQ